MQVLLSCTLLNLQFMGQGLTISFCILLPFLYKRQWWSKREFMLSRFSFSIILLSSLFLLYNKWTFKNDCAIKKRELFDKTHLLNAFFGAILLTHFISAWCSKVIFAIYEGPSALRSLLYKNHHQKQKIACDKNIEIPRIMIWFGSIKSRLFISECVL